jgi:cytochrome c-type biogenesis protein CcmH/NrfG
VYERTGRKPQAAAAYARALELEPDNAWVRDVLVPGVATP